MPAQPPASPQQSGAGRGCALWLGLGLGALAAALGALAWRAGSSLWTLALTLGLGLLALGCLAHVWSFRGSLRLVGAAAALIAGPWLLRALQVGGSPNVRLRVLPADSGPRLLSKLYPEPDGTLIAAELLTATGRLHDVEAPRFERILEQAYARTDPPASDVPTPAIATYLGLQSASEFDTLLITPSERDAASDAAIIFLHGYAGSFYVYCWELAQAAAAANLLTLCPATDASGAWWTPNGERVFQATLDYAHRIGMNRIYLAGLSNGAAGASVLAQSHARELSGLVLVSGVRAAAPPPLPTLVVQGASDQMMPAAAARAYAAKSALALYRELPGGHLIFLSEYQRVRPLIADFLLQLERRAPGSPAFAPSPKAQRSSTK